ncbi:FmdB family zinc ribbon protein [Zhihengliuella sp.]|uniref:FmdB family zinc ribbon protein n=1 Tax=Zhihengliuella sp. TaxID=1954483 RepID=UPI0028110703|nr:FmdB family zinc ribbon protein [Zhihengliuella sp.]
MPTYAYACKDCGNEFEIFQSFTDDSLTTCTACDGRLRKVFNVGGVVFKGSGFYRNDSRGSGSGSPASSDSSSSASSAGSSSAGSSSAGSSSAGSSSSSTTAPAAAAS